MMISNQYNQIHTSYIQSTGMQAQQFQTEQASANQSKHADKVTFSSQYEQMKQTEQDIANRYDVTNMSEVEKAGLAKELWSNKLIDDNTFAVMSFESNKVISAHLGIEYTGEQKRNVLQEFKNELEFTLAKGGETKEGIETRENIISILEKLQSLKSS